MADVTIDTLTADKALLEQQVATLNDEVATLTAANAVLSARVAELETATPVNSVGAPTPPAKPEIPPPFKFAGKLVRFTLAAFVLGSERVLASDLLADKERLKTVLETYPQLVQPAE